MTATQETPENVINFSEETLSVLKNFAQIYKSIVFRAGRVLKTVNMEQTITAEYTLPETESIPMDFGISLLSQWLNILDIINKPQVVLEPKHMQIRSGDGRVSSRYAYGVIEMIASPPQGKSPYDPTNYAQFLLTEDELTQLSTVARLLSLKEVGISINGNVAKITLENKKNTSSDNFSLTVECENVGGVKAYQVVDVDQFKFVKGSYELKVGDRNVRFTNINIPVAYWIPVSASNLSQFQTGVN